MSYRDKTPQTISLLIRRLEPGKTIEDFEKAHLPPVECEKQEYGYDCEYFEQPTRVIDCVLGSDPSVIVSIGMTYGDAKETFESVGKMGDAIKKRQELLADVVEEVEPTRILFTCGDHNFGGADPEYKQGPLQDITPELVEVMQQFK